MPILGTGAAGYSFADGARAVCNEVAAYDPDVLTDVRVIAYSQNEYETVQRIADEATDE